jgi:uncharacterized pyridoxamine 5'-phosphate oxidase family protein
MDLKDCIKFATEHPVCYAATADRDQPRVRTLYLWKADESGFYLITMAGSGVTAQLHQHPEVEVCFFNNAQDPMGWIQMRVAGKAEFLEDEESLEQAYQNRAWLDPLVGASVRPMVRPWRIATGEAHFWTMADSSKTPIRF